MAGVGTDGRLRSRPHRRDHRAPRSGRGRPAGGRLAAARRRARSPFELLREAVGEHGVEAKSISTADGDYGQMLVSRWPLTGTEVHDITHGEREPRRAIETDGADRHAAVCGVVATHFGLSLGERRTQARRLVAIARQPYAAHRHARRLQRLVLAGLAARRVGASFRRARPGESFSFWCRWILDRHLLLGRGRCGEVRRPRRRRVPSSAVDRHRARRRRAGAAPLRAVSIEIVLAGGRQVRFIQLHALYTFIPMRCQGTATDELSYAYGRR